MSKSKETKPQACELVLCEDPKTGELLVKPKGECPRGFLEKIRDKARQDGVTFLIPKVHTREVHPAELDESTEASE